jgi:hypothetical protein
MLIILLVMLLMCNLVSDHANNLVSDVANV